MTDEQLEHLEKEAQEGLRASPATLLKLARCAIAERAARKAAEAIIEAAKEMIACVELNIPEENEVQLRNYRKPAIIRGWTATQIDKLIMAVVAYEDRR